MKKWEGTKTDRSRVAIHESGGHILLGRRDELIGEGENDREAKQKKRAYLLKAKKSGGETFSMGRQGRVGEKRGMQTRRERETEPYTNVHAAKSKKEQAVANTS